MTEIEAIEELKYDCNELGKAIPCDTSWGCSFENAYGMAIQALEKQIPKKPIYIANLGYAALWLCPVCERRIVRSDLKYCHQCGQKLDWSDEHEID